MTAFTILLGGDCRPTQRLRDAVEGVRTIAADGGMRHAASLGLVPELWVGDFDSTDPALLDRYADVPRDTHPAAKDATDGAIALRAALDRGGTRIVVVGAFGGPRLDHALGTITLAFRTSEAGVPVTLTDSRQWGYPLLPDHPLTLQAEARSTLSVIGLSDLAGLTLRGVRWPLEGASVPFGSSLTLSNEVTGTPVTARLRRGRAVVMVSTP